MKRVVQQRNRRPEQRAYFGRDVRNPFVGKRAQKRKRNAFSQALKDNTSDNPKTVRMCFVFDSLFCGGPLHLVEKSSVSRDYEICGSTIQLMKPTIN